MPVVGTNHTTEALALEQLDFDANPGPALREFFDDSGIEVMFELVN